MITLPIPRNLIVLAGLFLALLTACATEARDEGSVHYKTQNRTVTPFSRVFLDMPGQVEIRKGTYALEVSAPLNVQTGVVSVVEGNTLHLSLAERIRSAPDIQFVVTLPSLDGIRIAGPGKVVVKEGFSANELSLDLSGPSRLTGDLDANRLEARLSGPSRMDLTGHARRLILEGHGPCQLYAQGLVTDETEATLNGPGQAQVHVANRLDATVNGPGTLRYDGSPGKVAVLTSHEGRVIKE